MKIGYKGFDKDLKCKKDQFVIGETYTKPDNPNPRLCTSDGFHYCNKLSDVSEYYSFHNDNNRFCEVEILGSFTDDYNKSTTTSLKVLREIPKEKIQDLLLIENMNLDKVRKIQEKYPIVHIGGSIGLFLHGIRLERWKNAQTDIDLISPYFILFESSDDADVEYIDGDKSGNDFDENFIFDGVKVDLRIDPKQRYEFIEFGGFKYKVSKFETIMEAKTKYAANRQVKHKEDIREMCNVTSHKTKETNDDFTIEF
jgi:hypothetical protein